jgi:hypothetical protein
MPDKRISQLDLAANFLAALEVPVNDASTTKKVTGTQLSTAWGLDVLGSAVLLSAAHETPNVTLTWPPGSGIAATRDFLWIFVRIASYGGSPDATGDIGSLRFNGDSGANYWTRHLDYQGGVWSDFQSLSTSLIRLAATNSRLSRNVFVTVNNLATRGKTCNIKNQTGTADAAVAGSVNIAGGEWVNLVDQITSVQLIDQGSNNMGTGSGFIVLGKNF